MDTPRRRLRWWDVVSAPPAAASAAFVARSVAFLFIGGAVLAWLSTLLPGGLDGTAARQLRVLGLAGVAVALGYRLLVRRLPGWCVHLWPPLGVAMVSYGIAVSGGGPLAVAYALLFAVIVVHAFSAFSWRAAGVHFVIAAVASSVVLLSLPGIRPVVAGLNAGALVMVAVCIGALARAGAAVEVDPLTSALNRRGLQRHLGDILGHAERARVPVVAVALDLDDFKEVNDRLGHAAGDRMLTLLTRTWTSEQAAAGRTGILARQGGDEFVAVLTDSVAADATGIVDRVRAVLPVGQNCSAGVAEWSPGQSVEQLVQRADAALYRAKRSAKGTTVTSGSAGDPGADVARGLAAGEFVAHYQPLVDIGTACTGEDHPDAGAAVGRDAGVAGRRPRPEVVGVEALVRWHHPDRGLLSPAEFLPDAAAAGLVPELGRVVLAAALADARDWRDAAGRPLPVSVNAAAEELTDPAYAEGLLARAAAAGFAPCRLCVEVLEEDLGRGGEQVLDNLEALRASGLRVAVDDFGAGWSNLARLSELPVDVLKVDRSLTATLADAELPGSPADGTRRGDGVAGGLVLQAALTMAESAALGVVVEGVETERQVRWLVAAAARRPDGPSLTAQGWFWSRALPPEQVPDHLVHHRTGSGADSAARPLAGSSTDPGDACPGALSGATRVPDAVG